MTTLAKSPRYRNKRILAHARGQDCALCAPGCNYDPATTVFAHLNMWVAGKGAGRKADDLFGIFMCSSCHAYYDSGQFAELPESDGWLLVGLIKTQSILLRDGVVK